MGPSLPTECEAACSACAVERLLAAWFYNSFGRENRLLEMIGNYPLPLAWGGEREAG